MDQGGLSKFFGQVPRSNESRRAQRYPSVSGSTPGTGITTISQGLVKIYYFDDFKPGIQKIKQTLIARFAFDIMTPKDTILKLFINDVYLGQHDGRAINGFENAARSYLSKSFKDLTCDEYLGLVAMIVTIAMTNANFGRSMKKALSMT